jgi:hypothetical protein
MYIVKRTLSLARDPPCGSAVSYAKHQGVAIHKHYDLCMTSDLCGWPEMFPAFGVYVSTPRASGAKNILW